MNTSGPFHVIRFYMIDFAIQFVNFYGICRLFSAVSPIISIPMIRIMRRLGLVAQTQLRNAQISTTQNGYFLNKSEVVLGRGCGTEDYLV